MNRKSLGELGKGDIKTLQYLVTFFKKRGFSSALHGTSLWNKHYKDIDLAVFSTKFSQTNTAKFLAALEKLQTQGAKITNARGSAVVGLDYNIDFKNTSLHISYLNVL